MASKEAVGRTSPKQVVLSWRNQIGQSGTAVNTHTDGEKWLKRSNCMGKREEEGVVKGGTSGK
jgi:hypothetical protein